MRTTAADIALEFIDSINAHQLHRIRQLVTADHLFIDAQGNQFRGQKQMERSWRACFEWFPDYSIDVDRAFANSNVAVITGYATGTYCLNGQMDRDLRWRTPSAWQGVMREGKLAEWRVYADNEPIWKVLRHGSTRRIVPIALRADEQEAGIDESRTDESEVEMSETEEHNG